MKWISSSQIELMKDEHGRLPAIFHSQHVGIKAETEQLARGTHEDTPFECTYGPGAADGGAYLVITLLQAVPCQFIISKKTPENSTPPWWCRFLGQAPTMIGDEQFDAENTLTIQTMKNEVLKRLSRAECQQAIAELREIGFTGIRKDALGIDAIWLDYPHGQHVPPQVLERALHRLQQLGGAFRDAPPEPSAEQAVISWHWLGLIAMPFALLFGALALMKTGNYNPVGSEVPRLLLTAIIPVAVLTVLLMLAQRWLNRTLNLSRAKLWFWRAFALAACMLSGLGLTGWLNGAFDRSDHRTHIQSVVAVGQTGCYADVESWLVEHQTERIPISCADSEFLHNTFMESGLYPPLEIVSKSGFLGVEWLVSQGLATDSNPPP